jgi:hypothetical protein
MGKPRKQGAAAFIGLGGRHPVDPDTLRSRMQERDQREASDTRTEAQRWLGDPEPARSALRQRAPDEIDLLIHALRQRSTGSR